MGFTRTLNIIHIVFIYSCCRISIYLCPSLNESINILSFGITVIDSFAPFISLICGIFLDCSCIREIISCISSISKHIINLCNGLHKLVISLKVIPKGGFPTSIYISSGIIISILSFPSDIWSKFQTSIIF